MVTKNHGTLDYYHKQKIEQFQEKLRSIERKIQDAENTRNTETIQKLRKQQTKIQQEETAYLLKVMDLLSSYYSGKHNQEHVLVPTNSTKQSLADFVKKKTKINKTNILDEYMFRLNNQSKHKKLTYNDLLKFCNECGTKQTIDTLKSSYVCESCGVCSFVLIEPQHSPFVKHPVIETNAFSYRRFDHFVEWLNKFHNIDKSKVPKKIYDLIRQEMIKLRKKSTKNITKEIVLEILKRTGNSKYNCQVLQIMSVLHGKKLPSLPCHVQETMKKMFKQTLEAFAKICPHTRTNFLSYSYVIRKFLELLAQYDYIQYFPLLKSKAKIYEQDLIWKEICRELAWKYIPTI